MVRVTWRQERACRAIAAAMVFTAVMACRAVTEGTEVSESRVALLRRLVSEQFARSGLEAPEAVVGRAVLDEFAKLEPDCPVTFALEEAVTDAECRRAARTLTQKLVAERFPDLDMEALEAEAAATYPIHAIGDVVELEYQPNPARRERVRGVYQGRTPGAIQIGRRTLLVRDIESIAANQKQLLMFDAERSKALRREHVDRKVATFEQERDAYEQAVRLVAMREQYRLGSKENEARGYVFHAGTWLPVREAIGRIVAEHRLELMERARSAALARVEAQRAAAAEARLAELAAERLAPNSAYLDPEQEHQDLQARLAAAREKAAAAPPAPEEEEAVAPSPAEAEPPPAEPAAVATPAVPVPREGPPPADDFHIGIPFGFVAALIGFFIVTAVVLIVYWRRSSTPAYRRFFEAKGKVQKSFWDMAEADPEGFKYVAYRFPSQEDARNALLHLSFIHEAPGGELKCLRDIQFGIYPHEDKQVAFVGGRDLHYALWREASATMPEQPGAEYFRVSTAPEVRLEVPEIEKVLHDSTLEVQHKENREGDDYSMCYVYQSPDKATALEFLRRIQIAEAGVHVVVETPEGRWGKDENGIYQE